MKNPIKSVGDFIRNLVADVFDFAERYADEAVLVTQTVKDFVEGNADRLDAIVKATDTDKDDKALALVRSKLPEVARAVADSESILTGSETDEEALEKFTQLLKANKHEGRVRFYIDIAARLLISILGKKFPYWLAVTVTQRAFGKLFKNAED